MNWPVKTFFILRQWLNNSSDIGWMLNMRLQLIFRMPYDNAIKKSGINMIRLFIHSTESIAPALPIAVQKRTSIGYRFKTYKDGKLHDLKEINTLEDAFPCVGDKK